MNEKTFIIIVGIIFIIQLIYSILIYAFDNITLLEHFYELFLVSVAIIMLMLYDINQKLEYLDEVLKVKK